MLLRAKYVAVVGLVSLASCSAPELTPESTVALPFVDIPFVKSEELLRQGRLDEATGQCVFESDFSVEPGELTPGQVKVRVQRALDTANCVEQVEEGVVTPPAQKSAGLNPTVETVYAEFSESESVFPDPVNGVDATYKSEAQVTYFDRESTFAGVMAPVFVNGNDVSHVYASVQLTTGDCHATAVSAAIGFNVFHSFLTGWSESQNRTYRNVTCDKAEAEAWVVHDNDKDVPVVLSCGEGVHLRYQPFRLTVFLSGSRRLSGNYTINGDKHQCGDYLTRVQTIS